MERVTLYTEHTTQVIPGVTYSACADTSPFHKCIHELDICMDENISTISIQHGMLLVCGIQKCSTYGALHVLITCRTTGNTHTVIHGMM